jgi:hypothetical protein
LISRGKKSEQTQNLLEMPIPAPLWPAGSGRGLVFPKPPHGASPHYYP